MTAQDDEITQRDLRQRSGEIMSAVEHGESFVVTRNGSPIGQLVPLRPQRQVTREEFAATSVGSPTIDLDQFRRDQERHQDTRLRDPYE